MDLQFPEWHIIQTLILLLCALKSANSCIGIANYNFTALHGVIWESRGNGVTYQLSVCQAVHDIEPDSQCDPSAAVCQVNSDGHTVTVGRFSTKPNVTETQSGVIQMTLEGEACPQTSTSYTTQISFKCGKTLGSPVFLNSYQCGVDFEWYTTVACKNSLTVNEVKCYVHNDKGKKIDLSPLIKIHGAYEVLNFGPKFYINICRDITPDDSFLASDCESGSAACIPSGDSYKNAGHVSKALSIDDSQRPFIKYINEMKGDDIPANCTQAPSTLITFVCPVRGESAKPVLLGSLDCQYEIMWETEYACPEETITSNTCMLTNNIHGVSVDLTPLKGHMYTVNGSTSGKLYTYYLSVCGEISIGCSDDAGSKGVSACQIVPGDIDSGKPLGKSDHEQLRYSDGELVLIYKGGATCHTNFQRTTVINFHCNKSLSTTGKLAFTVEDDCTYVFDLATPLACVENFDRSTCQVEHQGHLYDLNELVITENMDKEYWEALKTDENDDSFMILNVCRELVHSGLAMLCDKEAAACAMDRPGHWMNLGKPSQPVYDENTGQIQLHYTDGSSCNGSHAESIINFICKPGMLDSAPRLTSKSSDGCRYEFEWETASVCAQHQVVGDNCRVTDEVLGLSFDLHPLMNADKGYYLVHHSESHHDYYINVCTGITGTPCNTGERSNVNMAACQIDTMSKNTFVTGLVSSRLRYGDNFLNLTYTGGDPYNSSPVRNRSTEIAFFCNPTVGKGSPEFVEETDYTYVFRWATSYACADVPVECAAVDNKTGAEYDLTSLVRKPSQSDWVTVDDEQADQKKRTFYINICHHLVSDVDGCDHEASVCEKTLEGSMETVSHRNLGKSLSSPVIDSEGELTVVFSGGEPCKNQPNKNYTSKIHLHCDHGAVSTSPRLLSIDDDQCQYVFRWDHAAACPVQHSMAAPGDICTIYDSSLGFTYNLKPLTQVDYNVTHSGDTYQLHICGKVSGKCQRIGENEPAVCLGDTTLGEVNTELEYGGSGFITLTYRGKITGSGQQKVVIEFRCDRSVGIGRPQFIEKDGLVYLFRFLTSYACPPAAVECKAVDDRGNLFDLSYLSKTTGNWEVVDTRPNHGDLRYYINVCHPVNPIAGAANFCSGLAGSCQTDGQNQAYSLGYIQGSPVAAADGTVILRYTGGDRCHKDKAEENFRSTTITFYCSNVERDPVFINETADCQYHFSWQTPLACPVSKSVGSQCSVITPNFVMSFNLTGLQKPDYYKIQAGEYEFWLNVCKDISGVTGECQGVGSCQTKPSNHQMINAGKANGRLIYEDGELRLVYEGGKGDCHGQYERQTIITFTCDTTVGIGVPIYLNESSTCQYLFQWPTSLACATSQADIQECSIQDDMGKQYDLSGLRATNRNYVYLDAEKKVKYLINVCAGIIHGRGAACTANSAVCLVHLNATTSKYENLGNYKTSELKVESDMIILKYTGGHQCNNGGYATTTIQLKCDPTEVASEPYLLDDADGCNYAFQWMTSHACPINTVVTPGGTGGDCMTTDPQTGDVFSLAKLKDRKWTVKDRKGHSYDISICSALKDSYCGSNVASCQYETEKPTSHWSSGQPSTSLMYMDGTLRLIYTGGKRCHNDKYERTTVIDFVCGVRARGEGEPVFITEDANCTYFLSWHTDLACSSEPLTCSADTTTEHYDLSSLVLSEGYHSAITAPDVGGDASYYINLCRPLNPIPDTKCPPQAAVCKVDSKGTITSLGQALESPKVDPVTKKVTVLMEHGDTCASDRTQNWRTKIIFECDPGLSSGTPSLEEVNKDTCEVVFTWPTYLVCAADSQPDVDNDCSFTDHRRDFTYNFTGLMHKAGEVGYMVPSKSRQGTYYINICGSTSAHHVSCGSAGVCLVSDNKATSFGRADKMTFLSSEFNVKLIYTGGDDCQGQARESYIIMECDYAATGTGTVEVSYEQDCSVAFVFRTHLACPPVKKDCIFSHDGTLYDFTPLSRTKDSWILQDSDKNVYWLNLCQGVHNGPVGCPQNAAVCWRPADGSGIRALAQVISQTVSIDVSGNILLKYNSGDGLCHNNNGATTGSTVFKIYLTCGNGVGKPVFKSRSDDHCLFEVEWKTIYACKELREPVFAVGGYITDKRTNQRIPIQELSGSRNYELTDGTVKYILNLDGSSGIADCDNVVVCQLRPDNANYHYSLGEKDTETFFIKGEILEAHYTSPTPCDGHDSAKAMSIIDFHCSTDNRTIGPVFIYKSAKCQYIFDWFTPAVCGLAQFASPDTDAAVGNNLLSSATLGVILGVSLTVLLFVFLAMLLYKRERRARVGAAFRRLFRKPTAYTAYTYSSLNQAAEEESSLLHNSQGQYGADSQQLGNIQSYNDDSDEDILQL